jgi:hypothetical protein
VEGGNFRHAGAFRLLTGSRLDDIKMHTFRGLSTMTIEVTPQMIEATYDLLALTEPFRRWQIPHGENVQFSAKRELKRAGWQRSETIKSETETRLKHRMNISPRHIGHLSTLTEIVAHEMIHVYLDEIKVHEVEHGPAFRKLALEVCRIHGFDPRHF